MTPVRPSVAPDASATFVQVAVVGGTLMVSTLDNDRRLLTVDDSGLHTLLAQKLGPAGEGGWAIGKAALYDLVHNLRTSAETMPGRGLQPWPDKPQAFTLNTTWGRLGVTVWNWRGISVDISKAVDQAGVNIYMRSHVDARWNDSYSNWVIGKKRFDHIVLAHWVPGGAARVPLAALNEPRPHLPPSRRVPVMVDGHPVVIEPGRDGKIDRSWYKANQRWSRARCTLGEYFVYDLHDGCKAVMSSYNAIQELMRDHLKASRFAPVNGYVIEACSVMELNAAIAAAAGAAAEPGLRLV